MLHCKVISACYATYVNCHFESIKFNIRIMDNFNEVYFIIFYSIIHDNNINTLKNLGASASSSTFARYKAVKFKSITHKCNELVASPLHIQNIHFLCSFRLDQIQMKMSTFSESHFYFNLAFDN